MLYEVITNYNQAVRMVMELNERIEDKKVSPALAVNKDNYSFAHTAEKYTESRTIRPKTIERYNEIAANINKGFEYITGKPETPLQEISRQLVQDYIKYRQTTKINPNGHENTVITSYSIHYTKLYD